MRVLCGHVATPLLHGGHAGAAAGLTLTVGIKKKRDVLHSTKTREIKLLMNIDVDALKRHTRM